MVIGSGKLCGYGNLETNKNNENFKHLFNSLLIVNSKRKKNKCNEKNYVGLIYL